MKGVVRELHLIFEGDFGPESGPSLIEIETRNGRSLKVGRWEERGQYRALILTPDDIPSTLTDSLSGCPFPDAQTCSA